jgi:hypothetical protein
MMAVLVLCDAWAPLSAILVVGGWEHANCASSMRGVRTICRVPSEPSRLPRCRSAPTASHHSLRPSLCLRPCAFLVWGSLSDNSLLLLRRRLLALHVLHGPLPCRNKQQACSHPLRPASNSRQLLVVSVVVGWAADCGMTNYGCHPTCAT